MRKGGGLYKKTVNFFTQRKKPLRSRNLSNEEKQRKKTLKKKWFKSKEEKKELTALNAKLAPPETRYKAELDARTRFQKFFNRFYKKADQEAITPKQMLRIPVEGIAEVYLDPRKPFNRQRARIPNENLPDPEFQPPAEFKMVNGRRVPLASQIMVENMNIPLFYAMWKGEAPKAKLEDIPEEDFQVLADLVKQKLEEGLSLDQISRELFHMGEDEINEWIKDHEQGRGYDRGEYQVANYDIQMPDLSYQTMEVVKTPGAMSIGRYLSRISSGKRAILTLKQMGDHTCHGPLPNNSETSYNPLTTLKSNGCIVLYNGDYFVMTGSDFAPNGRHLPRNSPRHYTSAMLYKNWIVLNENYFPNKGAPLYPMMAKYFPIATYIQEALENWGIEGIDAYFLELLQMKYPQYAIKFTTYIFNTEDFSYQKEKLRQFENYVVIDKEIFPDVVGFTALNPFQHSSKMNIFFQEAAANEKLYGMSTYMAYAMKNLALPFWKAAFPSEAAKRNLDVYVFLSEQEKITVDYLQNLNFEERLVGSGYDFAQARDTYNRELGSGNTREGVIEETLSNYLSEDNAEVFEKHKRELQFYQYIVTKTYEGEVFDPKVSREDILHLLMKFVARNSGGLGAGAPPPPNADVAPPLPPPPPPLPNNFPLPAPPRYGRVNNRPPPVLEALPREIVWGNENENENANLPPMRRINLAPALGDGFGANRSARLNKTRKRKAELETYLEKAKRVYNSLAPRLDELEGRARFLTAKKRFNRLSNSEQRNLRNYQTLQEYPRIKQLAERELAGLNSILSRA